MIIEMNDYDEIKRILYNDEMWARISEDGQKKDLDLEGRGLEWYGFVGDNKVIGIFLAHKVFKYTLQVHVSVLEEYRDKYAIMCGKDVLNHFVQSDNHKMVASVPAIYHDVYRFTKKMGLIEEGINRRSYFKNGKMIDQYLMGITRKEAWKWLRQQ